MHGGIPPPSPPLAHVLFKLVYFCFQAYGGGFFLSKLLSLGLLPNFDLANGEEEEDEEENAEDGGGMVVSANKCTHFPGKCSLRSYFKTPTFPNDVVLLLLPLQPQLAEADGEPPAPDGQPPYF